MLPVENFKFLNPTLLCLPYNSTMFSNKNPNFEWTSMNPQSIISTLDFHRSSLTTNFNSLFTSALATFSRTFNNKRRNNFLSPNKKTAPWARISHPNNGARHCFDLAMSVESMEERLSGIPVYALSNSAEEFVLISGVKSGKSLGIFCLREEDAESLLSQMKIMDPGMREGSRVVAVALNKVFQLKVDGVSFRLVPDASQIMNAIKVKEQAESIVDGFSGVPVFQSKSLVLKSQNKRYRPVFFRKEDLEDSLLKASKDQNQLNPSLRKGDIQVSVLEDMLAAMKTGSSSKWDDVVFIPPGLNVSISTQERERPSVDV